MSVISTGSHPKALWPGVRAWVMNDYETHEKEYTQIFDVQSSKMAYEEDVELSGFGLVKVKAEGAAVEYDTITQGPTTRYRHVAYSLGYIVTREMIDDNLYEAKSMQFAKALRFSFATSKEIVHANVLNRAFTSTYTGSDGKELVATDHPTMGGTQSNELATPADLSEASLEDVLTMIGTAKNSRGLPIKLRPMKLVISPSEMFNADRLLNSVGQSGTANNDINAVRGKVSVVVNHYLTDADAWFVTTNAPNGLISFQRKAFEFSQDNDFDTMNAKAKGYERYSCGFTDWRGVYGSLGA